MKKLFFFAVAALALAACSKNELVESASNSKAISFQVASYVPQTKANVAFDESKSFITNAWFHDAAGNAAQQFMTNETVSLHDVDPAYWAPARTYFWPKTGYINFFSYAGTPAASSVAEGVVKYGNLAASPVVNQSIAVTDDALLASAAYRYSAANYNSDAYNFTYGAANTDVTGVPTLFHHILSKVSFIVKFKADGITDTKNKWVLTINSASLIYADNGAITVSYTDPNTTDIAWPYAATAIGWTPGTNNTLAAPKTGFSDGTDAVAAADAPGAHDAKMAGTQEVTANAAGDAISDGLKIFNEVTVLPQDLRAAPDGTNVRFAINYTLAHYYDNALQITETVNLTDAAVNSFPALGSIALADFKDSSSANVTEWEMNHKYIYTVTIRPDRQITFSPAVVDWEDAIEAGYVYPQLN